MIFDEILLKKHKNRAKIYYEVDGFYHKHIIHDMLARLDFFHKDFPSVLFLGTPPALFEDLPEWHSFKKSKNVQHVTHAGFYPNLYADTHITPLNNTDFTGKETLPHRYDLVLAPLCLHHVNDFVGMLRFILNHMQEDAVLIGTVLGEKIIGYFHYLFASTETTDQDYYTHRMHPAIDIRVMGDLLQKIGFTLPVTDCFDMSLRYSSIAKIHQDIKHMGESRALNTPTTPISLRHGRMIKKQLEKDLFHSSTEKYHMTADMMCFIGRKESLLQQKPAKPLRQR